MKVYSKRLGKRMTPLNIFALLFAAEHGLGKLGVLIEPWGDISEEMILSARKTIDEVLCTQKFALIVGIRWTLWKLMALGLRMERKWTGR